MSDTGPILREAGTRIDVVHAPIRYRRLPLLLLVIIAVIPALGLAAGYRWLDDEAERYDLARAGDEVIVRTATTPATDPRGGGGVDADVDESASAADALTTPLFQFRRFGETVADLENAERLRFEIEPAFQFLDENSCFAASVDGLHVVSHNPRGSVIPASTQKLLVAAVALEVLGPDHRFVTSVLAPIVVDGVVDGDVYLVGGGDPLLVSDDVPRLDDGFERTSLDRLADAFVAAGIERIRGAVIGDGGRYDDEFVVDDWGDGVAGVDAGPYDALLVNDAFVLDRSSRQSDPNAAAARELRRMLDARDIRVANGSSSGELDPDTSGEVRVIGTVESPPLSEVVAQMLTTSDNNTAEMLVKEIGFIARGEGTRAAGTAVVEATLRRWGVPMSNVRVIDGSGLSPTNSMTCGAMLAVVQRAGATLLRDALPVAARSGTLVDEFIGALVAGRLQAKTGTLGNPPFDEPPLAVKALAGYVDADNGDTVEFALIINAPELTTDSYRRLWALFGDRLATYPAGPLVDDLQPR